MISFLDVSGSALPTVRWPGLRNLQLDYGGAPSLPDIKGTPRVGSEAGVEGRRGCRLCVVAHWRMVRESGTLAAAPGDVRVARLLQGVSRSLSSRDGRTRATRPNWTSQEARGASAQAEGVAAQSATKRTTAGHVPCKHPRDLRIHGAPPPGADPRIWR